MNKNQKGFTIIELIVVIAIIAVLASIVMLNVTQYINKGRDAATLGNLSSAISGGSVYFADNTSNTGSQYVASPAFLALITAVTNSSKTYGGAYGSAVASDQHWCIYTTTYNKGLQCADDTGYIGTPATNACSSTNFVCNGTQL